MRSPFTVEKRRTHGPEQLLWVIRGQRAPPPPEGWCAGPGNGSMTPGPSVLPGARPPTLPWSGPLRPSGYPSERGLRPGPAFGGAPCRRGAMPRARGRKRPCPRRRFPPSPVGRPRGGARNRTGARPPAHVGVPLPSTPLARALARPCRARAARSRRARGGGPFVARARSGGAGGEGGRERSLERLTRRPSSARPAAAALRCRAPPEGAGEAERASIAEASRLEGGVGEKRLPRPAAVGGRPRSVTGWGRLKVTRCEGPVSEEPKKKREGGEGGGCRRR